MTEEERKTILYRLYIYDETLDDITNKLQDVSEGIKYFINKLKTHKKIER